MVDENCGKESEEWPPYQQVREIALLSLWTARQTGSHVKQSEAGRIRQAGGSVRAEGKPGLSVNGSGGGAFRGIPELVEGRKRL